MKLPSIADVVDLHHHLLPGVDDGATDLATALDLARLAIAEGITDVVATPHTCDGVYDVPRAAAKAAHTELLAALAAAGMALRVHLAAEVHLHEDVPAMVRDDASLSLDGNRRYLLLELDQQGPPPGLPDFLFRLRASGTTPVIAHPERYLAVRGSAGIVADWVHAGALLQLTAASLTGGFGEPIRTCALQLLRAGTVHIVATDAHSLQRRPPIVQAAAAAAAAIVGADGVQTLFVDNPRRVLTGAAASTIVPAPAHKRRGLLAALFR